MGKNTKREDSMRAEVSIFQTNMSVPINVFWFEKTDGFRQEFSDAVFVGFWGEHIGKYEEWKLGCTTLMVKL